MAAPKITHPALYRAAQFFAALKASLPAAIGGTNTALAAADESLVRTILTTPAQQRLFARMPPNDRRHAIAVVQTLQQAGHHHPALLQAALLHDVGKSLGQPIIHRVVIVLFEAFWPAALSWLSVENLFENPAGVPGVPTRGASQGARPASFRIGSKWVKRLMGEQHSTSGFELATLSQVRRWRRPFVVHAHHPAIGAAWAEEAACEPLAVSLIARHQEVLNEKATDEETTLLAALQWADDLN